MAKCKVEGCAREANTRGVCGAHYVKGKVAGDAAILAVMEPPSTGPNAKPKRKYTRRAIGKGQEASGTAARISAASLMNEVMNQAEDSASMPLALVERIAHVLQVAVALGLQAMVDSNGLMLVNLDNRKVVIVTSDGQIRRGDIRMES